MPLPESVRPFILQDARLVLEDAPYAERPDVADRALVFTGNPHGFRSLSAVIMVTANELSDSLHIDALPWVRSTLTKPFVLSIETEVDRAGQYGAVHERPARYEWLVNEPQLNALAVALHGIGYAWNHLHLDPAPGSPYAVVCYLE